MCRPTSARAPDSTSVFPASPPTQLSCIGDGSKAWLSESSGLGGSATVVVVVVVVVVAYWGPARAAPRRVLLARASALRGLLLLLLLMYSMDFSFYLIYECVGLILLYQLYLAELPFTRQTKYYFIRFILTFISLILFFFFY